MLENISLAFQGIWAHKMRSFLTMLGIIIGIASIITIVSTIKGTNDQIKESLIGSGTNAVTVQLSQSGSVYDMSWQAPPEGVSPITEETLQQLADLDNVVAASLFSSRQVYNSEICFGNTAWSGTLYGVDEDYFAAGGYRLTVGRGFLADDFSKFRKVAILDAAASAVIFGSASPVGEILEIKGEPFTVVGVVDRATAGEYVIESYRDYDMYYGSNAGGKVFIPLGDWPIIYRFDEPQGVILKAASTDDMTRLGQQAEDLLTASQISADAAQNGFAYKSDDLMAQAAKIQELSNATNNQLLWIAGISLLVGGIGVMNIMLVTVTERTGEIGLKKAIGARKRRILWQFLTEAAALTSIGGVLGVAAGVGLSRFIASAMGTPSAVSYPAIAVAVLFSMLIGVIFGMIPAVKAANLNPIDALRRE